MIKRPTRLSAQVFLDLPPVLGHYLENTRTSWIETSPPSGKVSFMGRVGVFEDVESLAVERRQVIQTLGRDRARSLYYRIGFEQGRRDALRHLEQYEGNVRLALQAVTVFAQMLGKLVAEPVRFEFDLESNTLYREITLQSSTEAAVHRLVTTEAADSVCWTTCGYLAGHTSEVLGRRVIAMEKSCSASGKGPCRILAKFENEYGEEANWVRNAFKVDSIDAELTARDEQIVQLKETASRSAAALNSINRRLKSDLLLDSLIAESENMQSVMRRAKQVAQSDVPVLMVGEPGTGRATLAKAIHLCSARKAGAFEVVDCRALAASLLVQELAGFAQGAFQGASRGHTGALARANKGTTYFDEITHLTPEAQGMLLRAMEDKTVTPLGAQEPQKADVRVIAATQYDPQTQMTHGKIREDLYYAIAIGRMDVPPLRDRLDCILPLAHAFMVDARDRYDRPAAQFSKEFKQALLDCAWPGNLRQLRNTIEHAVVFGPNRELGIEDLPEEIISFRSVRPSQELTGDVLRAMLKRTRGNRSEAAELLGIGRTTLWRLMKREGID
ncbi:MAG: sigma 54-interacting transcriptional regulator [Candidatus Hydrogenedentes bacterium]|nr:sigma 54-interacting transcriptional regulator [Candidatus Hydrogenedentota bacterium]